MTIRDKTIIICMLENNGRYPGDPQASSIYSYQGMNEEKLFAVFMDERYNDMRILSPYVNNPVLLWESICGLTKEGQEFFFANKNS